MDDGISLPINEDCVGFWQLFGLLFWRYELVAPSDEFGAPRATLVGTAAAVLRMPECVEGDSSPAFRFETRGTPPTQPVRNLVPPNGVLTLTERTIFGLTDSATEKSVATNKSGNENVCAVHMTVCFQVAQFHPRAHGGM